MGGGGHPVCGTSLDRWWQMAAEIPETCPPTDSVCWQQRATYKAQGELREEKREGHVDGMICRQYSARQQACESPGVTGHITHKQREPPEERPISTSKLVQIHLANFTIFSYLSGVGCDSLLTNDSLWSDLQTSDVERRSFNFFLIKAISAWVLKHPQENNTVWRDYWKKTCEDEEEYRDGHNVRAGYSLFVLRQRHNFLRIYKVLSSLILSQFVKFCFLVWLLNVWGNIYNVVNYIICIAKKKLPEQLIWVF